ncbi:hypothetical protein [Helicobacter sp.]|uniref:hypothetical protein n=1 Tax=Helicobacter sp. TaxID=218 RepID=UPI00388F4870
MDYAEFSQKIKELGLSRDEFARLVGMSYHSVTNWKAKEIPAWVPALLHYYERSLALDELLKIMERFKR